MITVEELRQQCESLKPADFIVWLTDGYLDYLGGQLTAENMDRLNVSQHSLMAYRYLLDEVMEGGFIQLVINGYAPYVLEGPFPMILKKEWGLKDLSKLLYEAKKEYHRHKEELDADMDDDEFMALYEQLEDLNDLGDDFLDDHQETATPLVAEYVMAHAEDFALNS